MFTYTLFKPPARFENRIEELEDLADLEKTLAKLLLQVELGFALTEYLQIDDEPVTVVCEILSKTPIRHPRLQNLSAEAKRAIANTRQIVPYSSRFGWLNALQDYIRKIPEDWRNYDFNPQDSNNQIIAASKNLRQQYHQTIYDFCLTTQLEFRSRTRKQAESATYYQFESATRDNPSVRLHVNFTQPQVRTHYPLPWLQPRSKQPINISFSDLEQAAIFLDEREEELAQQYSWSDRERGNWLRRFRKIDYREVRKIIENNEVKYIAEQEPAQNLTIDGFTHIPGMVASGKSTLSILIAVHIIKNNLDYRVTIVIGDTQAEIKLANQINWWFRDDPEQDDPVAVPILGGSQRDKHLRGFNSSNDYLSHLQRGQPHWGERCLSTVCPLQGRISQSDRINILNGQPLIPGKEPCHSLRKAPRDRTKKATGKPYFCPLFNRCPSKQAYRDMPKAKVWITTPGAMAQGGMPYHYELRPIKVGELVYEQSDIVIFDEVDTVIEWFDKVYAEQVTITNSSDGVFDEIGIKTEQYARNNRVPPRIQQRWNNAQRQGQNAISTTLTLLGEKYGHQILRDWTSRGYFTPHVLFFKLARRLAGLEEYNSYPRSEQQLRRENRRVQWIMRHFDDFLREDPTKGRTGITSPVARLLQIVQRIGGDSSDDDFIYSACRNWILQFFPNTHRRINRLALRLWIHKNQNSQQTITFESVRDKLDTIDSLALRLQFALTITLLDRHTKVVFYEWQNRPPTIPEASPHRRMPSGMYNILSLPVTGRQFGTYYSRNNNNTLTLFAYTNIGREYVLNYHNLFTDLDGRRGANVLALSGTSYLPDSTTFHITEEPKGVLKPEATAEDAIRQSEFEFLPQFDGKNKPIRVSGSLSNHKKARPIFKELVQSLTTASGSNDLVLELETLRRLGENEPELWADRDRVLVFVNSYDQADWVADEMRRCLPTLSKQIYHLVASDAEKSIKTKPGALLRANIEISGQIDCKILIAPMDSIGRGFNILNSNGKAAFGAVYFLIRRYPHPNDTAAIAQELNRRAYEWLETINYIPQYRALAVSKSKEIADKLPKVEQIYDLIFAWADTWTKQYTNKKKGNRDEIETVCDRFLDAIKNIPQDWQWEYIDPATLIEDINSNNALGYQAIPSLLATLLHEETITIQLKDREQKITWRKVQGGSSGKTGLHLVSYPVKVSYIAKNAQDDSEQEKEGYWAYRLDFHLHTQAGRFNDAGHLKPWVFLHLGIQRYADEPLTANNFGRDISILMGMNTARIDKYPMDSTLVMLKVDNSKNKWKQQLPDLLAAFQARSLIEPQEIANNPIKYGNLDNTEDWNKDEYYLIHAEGYKYREEGKKGKGHNHNIKTGFSLQERANITSKVLQVLNGVLTPDKPMERDIQVPAGKKLPLAMQDYNFISKNLYFPPAKKEKLGLEEVNKQKQEHLQNRKNIINDSFISSLDNKPAYLFIIYQEEHTRKLAYQQLRESLLLEENDSFPDYLIIEDILIDDETLLDRIPVTGLASVNKNFNEEIRKGHTKKRQAWQKFLKKNLIKKVKNKNNANIFAIIEIKKFPKTKGIDPKQNNIHAVIREACVLEKINSQMLQTVKPTKKDEKAYSAETRGRTLNAVLDLTLRQTGTLYGLPLEVYQAAKIPENISQKLDVIAFCRIKKNNFMVNRTFQYAIAVRLSATGKVDVLLPNRNTWISYIEAGIDIGKLFHEARKKDRDSLQQVQMKGGHLVKFVADTLVNQLENPTIALIEADVWRNERSKDGSNHQAWFQLKNEYLLEQRDILNFDYVLGHNCQYKRDNERLNNLLSVIRLRSGNETPQYITNRQEWYEDFETKDFTQLSGFIDKIVPELPHYFSIGKIPGTQKDQNAPQARNLSKIEHEGDIYAANIAYKHQQMIEMLPFFVRSDFQAEENIKALCRIPHYLRTSPAHTKGNIKQPYPMHLGIKLIEDMLCILDLDF